MEHKIFYNSEIQKIMKEFYKLQMEYLIKGIDKQPYEIMEELNDEK